ncbi:hypothetical protein [Nocardioides marmorisolisilvae]|uniref:Uncharacterized protein n=1 Tax=Nocardioides marmorisolisilvae TaxID=1542737 RepID=A0A3N0E0P0_9ACTN|nr:hypothetical protein [Nocardioides marmorisolisilvae]RNL81424.1 hypothetical protein EFL95_03580 [Nocardioides marmorisolisilvae]
MVSSAVLLVLLVGCGGQSDSAGPRFARDGDPALARALSFHYDRIGKYGQMDQVLTISSSATVPMTITARLTALDSDGKVLPGVTVAGVYGTEVGDQVLMPGDNLDVLTLTGTGAAKVRGVEVSKLRAARAQGVGVARVPVSARVVNAAGFDIATRFAGNGIQVENTNTVGLDVQVVAIIWSRPGKGESQQALQVLRIGGPTRVPGSESVAVRPSATVAEAIERYGPTNAESIRAYVTP